ncbi:MAG: sugar-binding domain-containing protein, partial [Promethearchaeota archaeon]
MTETPDWENARVFGRNREPPHCTLVPFADVESAKGSPEHTDHEQNWNTPFYKTLDGEWKFHWVEKPGDRPVGFQEPEYDVGTWGTIPVPSNWQRHGHGIPIYTNVRYPYSIVGKKEGEIPRIDRAYNPVGSYRRTFTVPGEWLDSGREVFLHFD